MIALCVDATLELDVFVVDVTLDLNIFVVHTALLLQVSGSDDFCPVDDRLPCHPVTSFRSAFCRRKTPDYWECKYQTRRWNLGLERVIH